MDVCLFSRFMVLWGMVNLDAFPACARNRSEEEKINHLKKSEHHLLEYDEREKLSTKGCSCISGRFCIYGFMRIAIMELCVCGIGKLKGICPRSDYRLLCAVELNPYCPSACLHCISILHTETRLCVWEHRSNCTICVLIVSITLPFFSKTLFFLNKAGQKL